MDKRLGIRLGMGAAALVLATGSAMGACQNTSGGGGVGGGAGGASGAGGGAGGGSPVVSFTPQGCGFTIQSRAEYLNFMPSQAGVIGATPNIRRVRLGLGGNVEGTVGRASPATSIGIAWQTDEGTNVSEVQWGSSPDPTTWPATNVVSGVTWDTPQGQLNPDGNERMHEAYICGLTPATTYYYRVGGGSTTAGTGTGGGTGGGGTTDGGTGSGSATWSPVLTFTTTPAPGPTPVTIAITGDSRGEQDDAWQILQRRLHVLAPTLQLFSGDVINLATDQGEWEEWLDRAYLDTDDTTHLTLSSLLTLAAHGNHDNHTALFFGNLTLPQDIAKYPQYTELFYSVDVGPVHIIVTDDSWVADPSGDQNYAGILKTWLDADLTAANANRTSVPWIITVNHRPAYSSSDHGMDSDVLLSRAFYAPIFQQYHVDVSFNGHDHDYERTQPLNIPADVNSPVNTTAAQGTVFVTCAGSGADAYTSATSSFTAFSTDFTSGSAIGLYGILTVTPTSLKLEGHQLLADATDPIFDTYTITK